MKKLLEGSGSGHCPRRNTFRGPGSGRMGRGHCRFTIPRGIDVEIDPKAGKDAPVKEEQPNPLTDHAKNLANAAKVFQEIAGNEYLQNFGNTISSILEQFGNELISFFMGKLFILTVYLFGNFSSSSCSRYCTQLSSRLL